MADLSRRAGDALRALVAAGRLKSAWVPGMRGLWSDGHGSTYRPRVEDCAGSKPWMDRPNARPDTDDPLTVFGLLLLLEEAIADRVGVNLDSRGWFVYAYSADKNIARATTRAEAIVAALETAVERAA